MRALNVEEVELVDGGSLASDVGRALGFICGAGAAMMSHIDSLDNSMLGAMQYGA